MCASARQFRPPHAQHRLCYSCPLWENALGSHSVTHLRRALSTHLPSLCSGFFQEEFVSFPRDSYCERISRQSWPAHGSRVMCSSNRTRTPTRTRTEQASPSQRPEARRGEASVAAVWPGQSRRDMDSPRPLSPVLRTTSERATPLFVNPTRPSRSAPVASCLYPLLLSCRLLFAFTLCFGFIALIFASFY